MRRAPCLRLFSPWAVSSLLLIRDGERIRLIRCFGFDVVRGGCLPPATPLGHETPPCYSRMLHSVLCFRKAHTTYCS